MKIDFKALAAKAVEAGVDMTQAVAAGGGGEYVPPAAGTCRVRFIGYVEVGKHTREIKGTKKTENMVHLIFELSGPKHQPKDVDGTKYPHRITVKVNRSLDERANFYKLFTRMNYKGLAKHFGELLGDGFLATVVHREWLRKDGTTAINAELKDDGGFTIRPPRFEDPDTGEVRTINVDPAISDLRFFLWDHADMDQWTSLFIDGNYDEVKDKAGKVTTPARSKNVLQNTIKSADNFKGSPLEAFLVSGGVGIDLPDSERITDNDISPDEPAINVSIKPVTPKGAAADDALNAIV